MNDENKKSIKKGMIRMGKIEIEVTKYFAGSGYDGYSGKFPEGGTIILNRKKECEIYGDIR